MSYKSQQIADALKYIRQAREDILVGNSLTARMLLSYALDDLTSALEIGPSEQAIATIVAAKKEVA